MRWSRRKPSTHVVPTRPCLEALEDRFVPSTVDLTVRGTSGVINDAIFRQTDAQPTGTGVIRAFVRVQTPDGNSTLEQGYNTEARPVQFDENNSPQFTRSLQLGGVPRVVVDGVAYREFLLDINQKSSQNLLSLDELRLYLGGAPDLTGYDAVTKKLGTLDPVYDLDAGGDNWLKLNYRLNAGSGSGDINFLVPESVLGDQDPNKYVYLFSRFGVNHGANSGFEEWAVRSPGEVVQPPLVPSSLSGFVYNDLNDDGVRDPGEEGIEGVAIQLDGTNDLGQTVVLVAFTDADGKYTFTDLRPGTYSLLEAQPPDWLDGKESIGTQGGSVGDDRFFDITLLAGIHGVENNFGEIFGSSG